MSIFNLYIIFVVLSLHYIADFICQSHEDATNKSTSNKHLLNHVTNYTLVVYSGLFLFIILPLAGYDSTNYTTSKLGFVKLVILNYLVCFYIFITHFATDYTTSRISSKMWKKSKMHEFFNTVGLDQLIHYVSLFTLLYVLQVL